MLTSLFLISAMAHTSMPSSSEVERAALVVGLSYENADRNVVSTLRNTIPQAVRYGVALDRAGFKTTVMTDGTVPASALTSSSLSKLTVLQGKGTRGDITSQIAQLPSGSVLVLVGHGGTFTNGPKKETGFFTGNTKALEPRKVEGVIKLTELSKAMADKGALVVLDACRDKQEFEALSSKAVTWQPLKQDAVQSSLSAPSAVFYAAQEDETTFAHDKMYEDDLGFGTGGSFFGRMVCTALKTSTVKTAAELWTQIQSEYQIEKERWKISPEIRVPNPKAELGIAQFSFPQRSVLVERLGVYSSERSKGLAVLPLSDTVVFAEKKGVTMWTPGSPSTPNRFAVQEWDRMTEQIWSDGYSVLPLTIGRAGEHLLFSPLDGLVRVVSLKDQASLTVEADEAFYDQLNDRLIYRKGQQVLSRICKIPVGIPSSDSVVRTLVTLPKNERFFGDQFQAFSPAAELLVTSTKEGLFDLYSTVDGKRASQVDVNKGREAGMVAFSPDGKWLILWYSDGLHVHPVGNEGKPYVIKTIASSNTGMKISRDSKLFVASSEGPKNEILVYQLGTNEQPKSITVNVEWRTINGFAISPDETILAVNTLTDVHLISISTGAEVGLIRNAFPLHSASRGLRMVFAPDGTRLYVSDEFKGVAAYSIKAGLK